MKAFIIRLFVALVLVTCNRDYQVNGECFELVQQYYECKNLVMIDPNDGTTPNKTYIPSTWVPNKILTDSFYQNLNLDTMTFDQAMDLFWEIYQETNNCSTDFCKCVSTGIIDDYQFGKENHFSLFFRNFTNFEQAKIILHEFIGKFQPSLKPYSALEEFFKERTHSNQVLPTLAEFCMKYDYTDERYIYYNDNTFNCSTDDITVYNCKFDIIVDKKNKVVKRRFTNPMIEKLLTCNLANAQNCQVEHQKFHLLTSWPQEYPQFAWQGDSLSDYYDKLITDSHSINPEMKFVQSYLKTKNDTVYVNNLNMQSSYLLKTEIKANLLDSPNVIIECLWSKKSLDPSDNNYYLSLVNFTFILSTGAGAMYFQNNTLNPALQQGFLAKNTHFNSYYYKAAEINFDLSQDKKNYDLYEFYAMNENDTYLHAFFNLTDVKLYLPDYQWDQSSSVLVNGFDGFQPITTPEPTTTIQTTESTQSTSESTERPTTFTNPYNSASSTYKLSFTFIITFLTLFILL